MSMDVFPTAPSPTTTHLIVFLPSKWTFCIFVLLLVNCHQNCSNTIEKFDNFIRNIYNVLLTSATQELLRNFTRLCGTTALISSLNWVDHFAGNFYTFILFWLNFSNRSKFHSCCIYPRFLKPLFYHISIIRKKHKKMSV